MEQVRDGESQQEEEMARRNQPKEQAETPTPTEAQDESETPAPTEAEEEAVNPAPTPLPSEVMDLPSVAAVPEERALHLRVMAAMLSGQADAARVEEALKLAQEVYELEVANASLDDYRSS